MFVREAKAQALRARSAFKLIEVIASLVVSISYHAADSPSDG
jgi:hypothetical protein